MRKIFSNTWSVLTKKERWGFLTRTLVDSIISIADIVFLAALLWLINFYIQNGTTLTMPYLPPWLAAQKPVVLISVFVVLFTLKNILAYFISRAHYVFAGRVAIRLSENMMKRYLRSGFTGFVMTDSSAWIRKIALQPFEFTQQVLLGFQQFIAQSILIIITIVTILLFSAKLFLLLLIMLLPPVMVVFFFIRKRLSTIKKNIRDDNERSYQYLLDTLKGYVEVNIYGRERFFLERFLRFRRQFSSGLFNSLSLQNLPSRVIEIFAVSGLFILVLIAEWTGDTNSSALLIIGAFLAAAYKIIPGMVKLINLTGQIRSYEFSSDELLQTADYSNDIVPQSTPVFHAVELRDVYFGYAGKNIHTGLSFSVQKGDFLGICGESGIGKTTIVNLLLGFLEPAKGEILINGISTDMIARKQYWPALSYVRQQSFFIYDTIEKNIILQEEPPDQDRLKQAVRISGLDKLIASFPEGLHKVITENGKNISGGQQQRIAMARALYTNADLILLDEPLNELDDDSSAEILEELKKECKNGRIIILITHDKKSLSFCNKTIFLDRE